MRDSWWAGKVGKQVDAVGAEGCGSNPKTAKRAERMAEGQGVGCCRRTLRCSMEREREKARQVQFIQDVTVVVAEVVFVAVAVAVVVVVVVVKTMLASREREEERYTEHRPGPVARWVVTDEPTFGTAR
ncbi:hypothetical protein K431DRAFT_19995 [Polychaeton citri CBS 116435]|uniref:Uncharacterized protein n=1 Tax=Polychaeton citri CBS 116435 TaxID=1314669 RepID=A0A9P4UKK7_9PEZI|nr:hypothetical protein K431DRAFT_19995 [Polychaeton citri CBS 116435]